MFGKQAEATNQESFSFERKDAVKPPGNAPALTRAMAMLSGGLLAAVVLLQAIALAGDLIDGEGVTFATVAYAFALFAGFTAATYTTAYGYTGFDSKRSARITGKVLLWTAIAVGVIALIALAGGFSGGSDDRDSDSGDSGDRGGSSASGGAGSSDSGSRWFPHFDTSSWGWGGGETPSTSRGSQPSASVCLSCGKRIAGPGGICTACGYRQSSIGW